MRFILFLCFLLSPLSQLSAHPASSSYCERLLAEDHSDFPAAIDITKRVFERSQVAKTRLEPGIRAPALAVFDLDTVPRAELKRVKMKLDAGQIQLLSADGQILFSETLNLRQIRRWVELRLINGSEPPFTLLDEVGVTLAGANSEEVRRFVSFRLIRGNRFLVTLGFDVYCGKEKAYLNAANGANAPRILDGNDQYCRIPIFTVNGK